MYTIGVDLGGTNIAIGIVNDRYEIVRKGSVPTAESSLPSSSLTESTVKPFCSLR